MDRRRCETIIKRPLIKHPEIKFDAEESADLKALARELATKVMAAADATGAETRACRSTRIAARRLQNMQPKAQEMALARARKLAKGSETCSNPGLNRDLAARLRKIIQIKTQDTHQGIRKAIDHVKDELVWINPDLSKTSVKLRLDSELGPPARREHCATLPPLLWAEWETSEPGADRIYWELRGPKDSQGTLPYIDSGYAENGRDDGTDPLGEPGMVPGSSRRPLVSPGVIATGGDTQEPAQSPHRMIGLMGAHESEDLLEVDSLSRANQAAAFDRISRSRTRGVELDLITLQ